MSNGSDHISLGEAAGKYLAGLPVEERGRAQTEINRFVRWFGGERRFADVAAYEVEEYAGQLSPLATDYLKKVEITKAFLARAKKEGWTVTNLGASIKIKKGKNATPTKTRQKSVRKLSITQQGYQEMTAELEELKKRRLKVIDDVRRAAEDKDFRENAPFHAAREERGHIEGRIIELEETLKVAEIVPEDVEEKQKISVGGRFTLRDMDTGEEWQYVLVSPREVAPAEGKISDVSPIGKAVVGRSEGEVVVVSIPAGLMRCLIKQVN